MVYSCPDTVRLCCFPHENVCQASPLQSKLCSVKTRLNWLRTVIDGQKSRRTLDEMPKSHRSRLDTSFAHDGRDPRSWPQTKPCRGQHVLEKSNTTNQHGAWISCARCAIRLHHIPRHTARLTSVSTPSSASVQEALKRMSLLRDNDFTAKAVRDMIAEVEGRKPRKKKSTPQTTIVYSTVYNSGAASSATISSGTPVRREISTLSDNSSVAPICCGHLPEGKDESQAGKLMMDEDL